MTDSLNCNNCYFNLGCEKKNKFSAMSDKFHEASEKLKVKIDVRCGHFLSSTDFSSELKWKQ